MDLGIRNKICLAFRNNWGLKVNIRYWLYLQYCRFFSNLPTFSKSEKEQAQQAHQQGVAKIGVVNVAALSQKVSEKFSAISLSQGLGSLPREEVKALAEPIFHALKSLESSVCAYYKSSFKVNWIDIQKIEPGVQPKGSSFSYHIDDSPYSIVKIFIYLTDTYEDNGAFRAFNYAWTDQFLKKGLLKSSQPGEMRDSCQSIISKEDEKFWNVIEGPAGTAFIFDNNLAHKGTLPNRGCRMHISMEIMPSTQPLTLQAIMKACENIPSDNYSPKPFLAGTEEVLAR